MKKRLLDTILTITGYLHLHKIYFWFLEHNLDTVEEIANESPILSQEEQEKMLKAILLHRKESKNCDS